MIRPVDAALVRQDQAVRVVAPASDAMTDAERLDYLANNPDTFLHVTRSPIDPAGVRTPEELAEHNHAELNRLRAIGVYEPHPPALYLYRIDDGEHDQVGLVADVALEGFDRNLIRPHERTRTDREDMLALHLRVVGAVASPVALTHHHLPGLAELLEPVAELDPLLDFVGNGGMHQVVWRVPDAIGDAVIDRFGDLPLYVTDGHHRLAAALRVRDDVERIHPGAPGPHHSVMAAIYPADQVRTVAFHRVVETDMAGDALVEQLQAIATVEAVDTPVQALPTRAGCFGLVHHGRSWRVYPPDLDDILDAVWLQNRVLCDIIGIESPRTDPHLQHVPGTVAVDAVAARADSNGAAAFLLAPTPVEAVMDAADRQDVLPPKSSFFTPKPRAGVFLVSRRPEI